MKIRRGQTKRFIFLHRRGYLMAAYVCKQGESGLYWYRFEFCNNAGTGNDRVDYFASVLSVEVSIEEMGRIENHEFLQGQNCIGDPGGQNFDLFRLNY